MRDWFYSQSPLTRTFFKVFAAIVLIWFLISWISGTIYDRDCGHFGSHAQAQTFYHFAGGPLLDFHNLDGDDDGDACESLP